MEEFQAMLGRRLWMNRSAYYESMNSFKELTSYDERIKFVFNLMSTLDIIPKVGSIDKDAKVSENFRKLGNKMFTTDHLDGNKSIKVLELYSKSIAFAPCNSEELSLAYANRSAVLSAIHKYEECIQDIDRALSLNYPDKLKPKLYVRKIQCLIAIGKPSIEEDYKTAIDWMGRMSLSDIDQEKYKNKLQQLKQQSNNLSKNNSQKKIVEFCKLKSQNIEVPCASDALAIKYNNDYGRHVVAVRDISVGELVVVENPYSVLLHSDYSRGHCSNCLNVSWASIPCNYCTYAMYCSEKCKLEEWKKYHEIECNIFSILSEINSTPQFILLSTRMAIQATRELNNLEDLRIELKEIDQCDDPRMKGFNSDNKFESDKYSSVYSLQTHVENRSTEYLFDISVTTAFALYLLATRTTIFGNNLTKDVSVLALNRDVTFIGGLILKHILIIPVNAHSFSEEYMGHSRTTGIMLLPFHSLINHSCNPNILRFDRNSSEIISYAIRPIKAGEQIFDHYGQYYPMIPKEERQACLLSQYFLECNCQPCKEDWPLYFNLPVYKDIIRSLQVKGIIVPTSIFNEYLKLATNGDVLDKPYVLENLLTSLKTLYEHVPMPCKAICDVIEIIKRIYGLQGYTFDIPVDIFCLNGTLH